MVSCIWPNYLEVRCVRILEPEEKYENPGRRYDVTNAMRCDAINRENKKFHAMEVVGRYKYSLMRLRIGTNSILSVFTEL